MQRTMFARAPIDLILSRSMLTFFNPNIPLINLSLCTGPYPNDVMHGFGPIPHTRRGMQVLARIINTP